jgi:lipopolysaccharide transport system permease protein
MSKTTEIKPESKLSFFDAKEVYQYRELFLTLALRDIKVKYKQTVIGALWAIIQPLTTMIIFSFFFGKIAQIPSDGVPYPVFSYSGLLLWMFFANSLSAASQSMISSSNLISKVYFPRLIVPIASTLSNVVDYFIASIILFFLMLFFNLTPSLGIVLTPLVLFLTWMLANGIGFFLTAVNVKYRDVRYAVPFFIQLLIYVTPVIYPISVAGQFKWLVSLNPMSGLIEAHRALILGNQAVNIEMLLVSALITIVIFIFGLYYFKSVERYFADII